MDEIRVLAPSGMLGSGYLESSLSRAMEWEPHFLGCDAGSSDPGPDALGRGGCQFPKAAVKRDLRLMLLAARSQAVPAIVGSAGTAGGDLNLAWTREIVEEIAYDEGLHFRMAVIHSEQDKEYLKRRLREGRIKPLRPAPSVSEEIIDRSAHIVGMMGAEPFARAVLDEGADMVLAGRSSDTSIFAALPVRKGFSPGPVWHAAKILECGAASVAVRKSPDCMMAWVRQDHFVVEPPNPEYWCTPQSVASHTLYENADPFYLVESSGTLDTSKARYEAVSDRAVRVRGSQFVPAKRYTVKLEGAELVGYQSVVIGGVRDPIIIRQLDDWLARMRERLAGRIRDAFGGLEMDDDYRVGFRVYGLNGTMGPLEPVKTPAHEVCLFIEITASSAELARAIADSAHHLALHFPVPEWHGLISGLAFPYSPPVLDRGAVYRFNLNHVVEPDTPYEMFPMEMVEV
ncbi:MAG: acyclic terpene utilization AtuA family protein [Chloroflexi bacterium]|nr:acyclic terpene utilization AtuA family protein [Chloroflexota bacterium]